MPELRGFRARVRVEPPVFIEMENGERIEKMWTPETSDFTQDLGISTNFISGDPGQHFSLLFGILPEFEILTPSVSCLLLLDEKVIVFKNFSTRKLMDGNLRVLSMTDLTYNQSRTASSHLQFGSTQDQGVLELRIFRMKEENGSTMMKAKNKEIFYAGQLVKLFRSDEPLGVGEHWIVSQDQTKLLHANFLDGLDDPLVKFTWKYRSAEVLQAPLITPRPIAFSTHMLLSAPHNYPEPDLQTPVSSKNLILDLDLAEIDHVEDLPYRPKKED